MSKRYEQFREEELILRDQLAIDRTKLANDRTLLAYARTGLTLFIAGVTALKFVAGEDFGLKMLAWSFIFGGVVVFLVGAQRYKEMSEDIEFDKEQLAEEKKLIGLTSSQWRKLRFPTFRKKHQTPI